MDEFDVLVESIGFKAHGKLSAPLADLKGSNNPNPTSNRFPRSNSLAPHDPFDVVFNKPHPNSDFDDDVFGVFNASTSNPPVNQAAAAVADVFGLMKSSSSSVGRVLGNSNSLVDDLLGDFGGMGVVGNHHPNLMTSVKSQQTAAADLLSDFGVVKTSSSLNNNGRNSDAIPDVRSAKSFSASAEDLFGMFESTQGSSYQVNNGVSVDDYLDSLFSSGAPSSTRATQSSTTKDFVYDALFSNNVVPKQQNKACSVSSNSTKQASSKANSTDDFSYLFGMGVAIPSGEFHEIEGESEERRKARFNHHMTTRERMNNALNEKNKRDLQAQQEQDEKHRVAVTLDGDIKRWAIGKEGNLRALLSSLQYILWAGSGWQPISLTDLITSTSVKKAYYKATLCVHPDKVQQKGASVQQKYIAEKVFDLLKESWNKFNAEEFKKQ